MTSTTAASTKSELTINDAMEIITREIADVLAPSTAQQRENFGDDGVTVSADDITDALKDVARNAKSISAKYSINDGLIGSALGLYELDAAAMIEAVTNLLPSAEANITKGNNMTAQAAAAIEDTQEAGVTGTSLNITFKDKSTLPGINAMLGVATGNPKIDIEQLVAQMNEGNTANERLTRTLKNMSDKMAKMQMASACTGGTAVAGGEELEFEVEYVPANSICNHTNAAGKVVKPAPLSFLIPTLKWKRKSDGAAVQHPECPTIDEAYQFTPTMLIKFLTAFAKNMNVWAHGHTGTGKSTFVEQIAARIGFPVARVNLDSSLERSDLVGHVVLNEKNGATTSEYVEGILPRAMQRPGFLLLDEIDAGRPDILFVIQRALEGNGLMLTEDHGRIVLPHPLFRFTATANTRGQGDEFGIYQGTRAMNTAMLDRFPVFVEFNYLAKDAEIALLKEKHPDLDDTMAEQIVAFANELRKAFMNGELFQPVTPRGLHMLAETFLHFESAGFKKAGESLKWAVEMTVVDKATKATQQKITELFDRCFRVKDSAAKVAASTSKAA